jgi:KaiC/GvpD/RAD55 family RecA-like ATPase
MSIINKTDINTDAILAVIHDAAELVGLKKEEVDNLKIVIKRHQSKSLRARCMSGQVEGSSKLHYVKDVIIRFPAKKIYETDLDRYVANKMAGIIVHELKHVVDFKNGLVFDCPIADSRRANHDLRPEEIRANKIQSHALLSGWMNRPSVEALRIAWKISEISD